MHNPEHAPRFKKITRFFLYLFLFLVFLILIPKIYSYRLDKEESKVVKINFDQFPVTVIPSQKLIVENQAVNTYLESSSSPLQANAISTLDSILNIFKWLAVAISDLPIYQNLSFVGSNRIVNISPGLRKEQVVNAFTKSLNWDYKNKVAFLNKNKESGLPLDEGSFAPGFYHVQVGMNGADVQKLINKHFTEDVLAHYGTSTSSVVPLNTALTIASLIERETINNENARIVSGIIWNRIFLNMNLQLDASLQYVKASNETNKNWWPKVVSKDKYLKSKFNTYMYSGLPPGPIANPSVASIVAALNPIKTNCLFYFNDDDGDFHCSKTYEEHLVLLKKYFGQGR